MMKLGEILEEFSISPHPKGISLEGKLVVLKPLKASDYSKELFEANSLDKDGLNWTYLHYGPFETEVDVTISVLLNHRIRETDCILGLLKWRSQEKRRNKYVQHR